jgi:G3E family GTPase
MIPICLITGFLGCGKTTFLKQIIAKEKDRRIVYLVNEFASVDIDGELIKSGPLNVISIPGGSIFCKCLVSEFIKQLRWVAETFDNKIDGLVIEASGMANPMVILDMLKDTTLDAYFRISRIVSVIDPRSLLALVHTLANIKEQIKASDTVLLNKVDLYSGEMVMKAEETLLSINQQANIVNTTFCNVVIDLFPEQPFPLMIHGEYSKCRDPHFESVSITVSDPINIETLKEKLMFYKDEIYRAKGFVPSSEGTVFIDFSQAGFTSQNITSRTVTDHVIAFIIKGDASKDLISFVNATGKQL